MFRLALSSHIYFFAFRETNRDTLVFLRSETRAVATRVSERKWVRSTELDTVNGSFCNLRALALWLALHIFATQCWRAPTRAKQLSTVAILLYRFLSCWCLETFFRSISLAVFCLFRDEPLATGSTLKKKEKKKKNTWQALFRLTGACGNVLFWVLVDFHSLQYGPLVFLEVFTAGLNTKCSKVYLFLSHFCLNSLFDKWSFCL